jgi:hypothetical protein
MRTQYVTTTALAEHLGNPPAYGETAAAVLETCALVADAEEHWDPKQVIRFQEEVGIHEKVWSRLLAIHRCTRWQEVDQSDLPENYTSLYSLTTLSDDAWQQLLVRQGLSKKLRSRQILQYRLPSLLEEQGYGGMISMFLAYPADKTPEELFDIVSQLKDVAKQNGAMIAVPGGMIRRTAFSRTPEEKFKAIADSIKPGLIPILQDAGKVLKDSLGIQSEEDLINASMRDFLKFINRTAGSSAAALETYGKQYCLKLALEYNRMSNTRANRFNYKKKLEELAEHCENQGLKDCARTVFMDFIGEVPGEK